MKYCRISVIPTGEVRIIEFEVFAIKEDYGDGFIPPSRPGSIHSACCDFFGPEDFQRECHQDLRDGARTMAEKLCTKLVRTISERKGPVCPVCYSSSIEYLGNHWICHDCQWQTTPVVFKPPPFEGNPNENISCDYGNDD